MSGLHIVIADPTRSNYAEAAKVFMAEGTGWEVQIPTTQDESELISLAKDCNVLITRKRVVPAAFFDRASQLRSIYHLGLKAPVQLATEAATRSISLTETPSPGNVGVAEHTMALMLAVSRRVIPAHLGTVAGDYRQHGLTPALSSETQIAYWWLPISGYSLLWRKQLGLIGLGDIGQAVARMARGFEMKVCYYRRNRLSPTEERELGVEYRELDALISSVDYLSLHVPHTPETEKILSAKRLQSMKRGAYLVNASRGGLVDEPALVEALRSGHLGGAGLDVFVEEPVPHDNPLLTLENVVLSPHVGSAPARGLVDSLRYIKPELQHQFAR